MTRATRSPLPARLPALLPALLAVLVAAVLALGLLPAPAEAAPARRSTTDVRRDVLKEAGTAAPVAAPRNASADITRTSTVMTPGKLVLQTSVRRLPRNFWAFLWQVQTDTGAPYSLDLMRTGEIKTALSQGGVAVACEGLKRKVEPRRSRVTVAVPLACLGSPTTVRTGAGAAATTRDFSRIYTDDALRDGAFQRGDLRLGRKVSRA